MDKGPETRESILRRWVGNWIELHYAASGAEVTPHGEMIAGPAETRLGTYRLEAVEDGGIEAFVPDPGENRTLFVPWNSVLLIRGPSREELEREQAVSAEEGGSYHDRRKLMDRMSSAQSQSEVDDAVTAANEWLISHPSDGDVRAARDRLRTSSPSDEMDLEEGNPT